MSSHTQITSLNIMNHIIVPIETGSDRYAFLVEYLKGKRVLHIGCTDHPRFNPEKNLHISLSKGELAALHGLDVDAEGIETLRQYVDGPYFTSYDQVTESYDVVLAPEVMEHVLDAGSFLKQLMSIDTNEIIITVPNAIDWIQQNMSQFGRRQIEGKRCFIETVHADHCYYFSPMTLATIVQKAIDLYGANTWERQALFINNVSVGCTIRKLQADQ